MISCALCNSNMCFQLLIKCRAISLRILRYLGKRAQAAHNAWLFFYHNVFFPNVSCMIFEDQWMLLSDPQLCILGLDVLVTYIISLYDE